MIPKSITAASTSLVAWLALTSTSIAEVSCAGWDGFPGSFFQDATAADVARCIATGADPNAGAGERFTPLHRAASVGNLSAVTALLEAGANPNVRNQHGDTPLHSARERNAGAIIAALTDAGADPNARGLGQNTPLHASTSSEDPVVIMTLIGAGADPNARNYKEETPLHQAALMSNLTAVVALLQAGADPNVQNVLGKTPLLHDGLGRGNPAVVTALLQSGADPNAEDVYGWTPLLVASKENRSEVFAVLVEYGATVSSETKEVSCADWNTAMFFKTASTEVVTRCLEEGGDLKPRPGSGWTALHFAAAHTETASVISTLLDAGADLNARTSLYQHIIGRIL